jgi:hypothetical protein
MTGLTSVSRPNTVFPVFKIRLECLPVEYRYNGMYLLVNLSSISFQENRLT